MHRLPLTLVPALFTRGSATQNTSQGQAPARPSSKAEGASRQFTAVSHTRPWPRRRRRGISLIEAVLSLILFAIAADGVTKLLARELVRASAREEFRLLDDAAEAGAAWIERNLQGRIAAAQGTLLELDQTTLRNAGLWSPAKPFVTRRKRDIRIWYHAPDADSILVFAVAATEITPPSLPEADPAIEAAGWISPINPSEITGPGVSYVLPAALTSTAPAAFQPGAAIAMRHLSLRRDALPYLYRIAIPGRDDLNTMSADLLMGGNSILGVDTLAAQAITAGTAAIDTVTASSIISTGNITAETATLTGALTAESGTFSDALSAPSATFGSLEASSLVATSAQISTTRITDHAVAGRVTATGAITATRVDTPSLTSDQLSAGSATVGNLTGTNLSADTATIRSLFVNSCTGC